MGRLTLLLKRILWQEQLRQMREEMGLNKLPLERYLPYLQRPVRGDFGGAVSPLAAPRL
jgi:ABC-type dipeptide/oligopeptide/nickel transport system permease component